MAGLSPVNASLRPSRVATHDSGSMWLATPSPQRTFTSYLLPVSGAPVHLISEGQSLAKAAERCQIDPSTAFRWRHRFAALNHDKPKRLSGIVEADETFILESFKGRRAGLARLARRRGGKAAKRGLSAEQIPVVVARDRSGATFDAVLPASTPPA